ncbi:hypothetical protein CDD83_3962 [Cordyceps sp. RAO-2017]|nr:hypothetical protein CDD83_3962 [Cordyceps sp. RAO-2017]
MCGSRPAMAGEMLIGRAAGWLSLLGNCASWLTDADSSAHRHSPAEGGGDGRFTGGTFISSRRPGVPAPIASLAGSHRGALLDSRQALNFLFLCAMPVWALDPPHGGQATAQSWAAGPGGWRSKANRRVDDDTRSDAATWPRAKPTSTSRSSLLRRRRDGDEHRPSLGAKTLAGVRPALEHLSIWQEAGRDRGNRTTGFSLKAIGQAYQRPACRRIVAPQTRAARSPPRLVVSWPALAASISAPVVSSSAAVESVGEASGGQPLVLSPPAPITMAPCQARRRGKLPDGSLLA